MNQLRKTNVRHPSPHHITEEESDRRAVKSGWYEMHADGKIGAGPFPSQKDCSDKISARSAAIDSYYRWRGKI